MKIDALSVLKATSELIEEKRSDDTIKYVTLYELFQILTKEIKDEK